MHVIYTVIKLNTGKYDLLLLSCQTKWRMYFSQFKGKDEKREAIDGSNE